MRIVFVRHGAAAGNLEKRYIGTTDEPLCREGIAELRQRVYPRCEVLVCSPLRRCTETAEIIYPGQESVLCPGLRECDFGSFEGKNYNDLNGDPAYQRWIDSGGELPFPGGEAPADFRRRCVDAYQKMVSQNERCSSIAFVVHGGTIMAVLEKFAVPHRDYFGWHCKNGCGYVCELNGNELVVTEEI